MARKLPSRPHLDHLRAQAKALLADLKSGVPEAFATFRDHLPEAKALSDAEIGSAGYRLADAQSAIARKTGFASWPKLARHVEQLRGLEGTWEFAHLEIDSHTIPASALVHSRLLIDGDRFRTESPEATYEGVFNINVDVDPHEIDIEFVEGPEAGNWNYGIFRLDGDRVEFCLDMNGRARPLAFASSPGSGHAYETLTRTSAARPVDVTGGKTPTVEQSASDGSVDDFAYVESPTLTRLEGDWDAVRIVRDGQELPAMMLRTGSRTGTRNQVKVSFGGQVMIDALLRVNEATDPIEVDYLNQGRPSAGCVQLGIMKWVGDEAVFCMAASGGPRPDGFESPAGSGRTLSHWRPRSPRK